jgi:hypothetical protein
MTTTTNIKKDKLRQVIERNWEMANSLVDQNTRRDHVEHIYKALEQDYDKYTEKWLLSFIYLQDDISHYIDDEEWGVLDYRLAELIQKIRSFDKNLKRKLISPDIVAKKYVQLIGTCESRYDIPEEIASVITKNGMRYKSNGDKVNNTTLKNKKVKRGIIQTVLLEAHKIEYDYNAGYQQSRISFDESGGGIVTEICKLYIKSLYKTFTNNKKIERLKRDVERVNEKAKRSGLAKLDDSMWQLEKVNTLNSLVVKKTKYNLEQKQISILEIQSLWCNPVLDDLEDHYRNL